LCDRLSPFRKLSTAAVLVAVVASVYLYSGTKDRASRNRITLNEVELVTVTLQRSPFGGNYRIIGSVQNRSPKYTLSDFTLNVTLEDCITKRNCYLLYQAGRLPLLAPAPPSQTGNFEITGIGDHYLRFKGVLRWKYTLVEVRTAK